MDRMYYHMHNGAHAKNLISFDCHDKFTEGERVTLVGPTLTVPAGAFKRTDIYIYI